MVIYVDEFLHAIDDDLDDACMKVRKTQEGGVELC